jgi:hypothetical protein
MEGVVMPRARSRRAIAQHHEWPDTPAEEYAAGGHPERYVTKLGRFFATAARDVHDIIEARAYEHRLRYLYDR